jgi:hypothetical protein
MAHVAIQQADDEGNFVAFGERVSDEQYGQHAVETGSLSI